MQKEEKDKDDEKLLRGNKGNNKNVSGKLKKDDEEMRKINKDYDAEKVDEKCRKQMKE